MADRKTAALAEYEVMQSRDIAGLYRKAGEIVTLTPAQAKYYLPPHGTGLKPVAAASAPKPVAGARKSSVKAGA